MTALRLLFAGTPQVAVTALDALLASRHEVVGVLTRPAAVRGRGRRATPSPVAERATAAGIPVLTPTSLRDPAAAERLHDLAPDCCPVVAYGALVPPALLDVPAHGWVNLHFSLLPAWRGAAPVQHAVMAGDEVTGTTTFRLDAGMDTGPVLGTTTETVRPDDTAGDLLIRLADQGARLLVATLDGLADGMLDARPQPVDGVSHAPKLASADARIDWTLPALAVERRIRGCTPAPGAWTTLAGDRVKIGPVQLVVTSDDAVTGDNAEIGGDAVTTADESAVAGGTAPTVPPGQVWADRRRVLVGTATGPVRLGDVQPPGRRPMPAVDWVRGLRDVDVAAGDLVFGAPS